MPEIIEALDDMDWQLPTPVQTEAIPLVLGGGDVAVAAETGSGKTGAFCLPIVQIVYETRNTDISKPLGKSTTEEREGPIRLSSVDRGRHVAVSKDGIIAQSRHTAIWDGVRATRGVSKGKWYFVARARDDGLCRVGWSSSYARLNLGTDPRGFGYGGTAMKSNSAKFDPYGEPYGNSDIICCMLEITGDGTIETSYIKVSFLKNEDVLGPAFSIPCETFGWGNFPLIPTASFKNAEIEVDFTRKSYQAEQLGFRPMSEATANDAVLTVPETAEIDTEMKETQWSAGSTGERGKAPLALILEPSRELAGQVQAELEKFTKFLASNTVRHILLTGGGNPKQEKAALSAGRDIVSGTLGSIVGHVKKGTLSLDSIRFFVLDEADTFATDNVRDILFLHSKIPVRNRVQTLLFSATLHSAEIKRLSEDTQSFPTWVDLKGKESVPDTVHHTMIRLDADADINMLSEVPGSMSWPLDQVHVQGKSLGKKAKEKDAARKEDEEMVDASDYRSQVIKKLKLVALRKTIDAHSMTQAMIFVRTQQDADNVESFLLQCSGVSASEVNSRRFRYRRDTGPEVEYSSGVLHGGKRQEERNEALAAFKAGEVRFLICTDVAARGIDIVGLPYLVNVSLPDKSENYIHRVGRVGRADRLGLAVSLVAAQKEAVWYHTCNKARGGICKSRKLVDAGGCVIWQNESKMLLEIEERLKGRIEELEQDFRRKNPDAALPKYGTRVGEDEVNAETAKHVEQLKPSVQKLVKMEEDAQLSFFAFQGMFQVTDAQGG